jgi:hypothetical protein
LATFSDIWVSIWSCCLVDVDVVVEFVKYSLCL